MGKSCSRFKDIDDKTLKRWKKQLGTVPKLKLVIPEDVLVTPPPYELNALAQIHDRSYECNVLLEIRDVRVPASSHHPSFTRLAEHRLHLICYTHADAIDSATRDRVEAWTEKSWPKARCIFVDTREHRSFKDTTKTADGDGKDQGEENEKIGEEPDGKGNDQGDKPPTSPFDMVYDSLLHHLETRGGINSALTVGVSNTGKSSLLLALIRTARLRGDIPKNGLKKVILPSRRKGGKKKKKKLAVHKGVVEIEDKPGKTREITEYLLRGKPRAFFLDVPGMTPPPFFFLERPEAWFAFGAANLLPLGRNLEKDVEVLSAFCNYLLYAMNRDANFGYVAKLGLDRPTLDLQTVLDACKKKTRGKDYFDPEKMRLAQCQQFLKLFNTGNFGPVILDDLSKPYERFIFKDSHFKKKTYSRRRSVDEEEDNYGADDTDDDTDDDDNDDDDDDDDDSFYKR